MKRKVMIILYKYKKNSKRAEERRLAKAFKIINFRKLKLIFALIRRDLTMSKLSISKSPLDMSK